MDTQKLIPIDKRTQIISAIEKGSPFGGNVWQTTRSGREVLQITHMHVDIKFDKVFLRTNKTIIINPLYPLFIHLNYRSLIFRLDPEQYRILGDKIVFDYPREACGLEVRTTERYLLPYDSDISLSIKRKIRTLRETVFELEVRIVDVSESGFGLLLSGYNRDFLRQFDRCWIKAIDHQSLFRPISGKITYVAPKGYFLKRGEVRVGVSLESKLQKEMLDHLKGKSRQILCP